MAKDDWYRNTDWNSAIQADFEQRLRRARYKSQYLRIQAFYLSQTHPEIALNLIDQYFILGDQVDAAAAHVIKAEALVALGDVYAALSSYEDALERERQFPNWKTDAYLDFACLVATARAARQYSRALEVLDAHRKLPAFPVQRYRAHGARALLLQELGRVEEAHAAAHLAMAAARESKSGVRYHQHLGLVKGTEDEFSKRVAALAR